MRKLMQVAVLCAVGVVGVGLAAAETPNQPEVIMGGGPRSSMAAATVTNEPFSAVWTKQVVKTLANGTTVTRHGHHFVARDSEGRVRVEQRLTNGKNGTPEIKLVFVKDPVAHTLTTWVEGGNSNGKPRVATVIKLPDQKKGAKDCLPCEENASSRPQPVTTTTDLGSQVMDDVAVSGKQISTVVPRGRSGNDQPITKTHEIWTSDEMKLILMQKFDDPRIGDEVVQLTKFSRAEPAAELFHPPAGYQTKTALESLKEMMAKLEAAQEQEQ